MILLVLITVGVIYVAAKLGKIEKTKLDTKKLNISDEVDLGDGYTNLALFGLDSRYGELGEGVRSDSIIVASLNNKTKEIKMVSIYRDTLLELEDRSLNKANSAYAFGGPEAAVAMLNKNLDLNIEDYIAVNFNALVDVIELLGGMELELTDEEVVHMNNYCVETSEVTGRDYTKIEPEVAGTYQLNGVQATSYARIRYTAGGDFERSERQRLVLEKIAEKAKKANLGALNSIIDQVFPQVATSMELNDMLDYVKASRKLNIGPSMGFPKENTTDTLSGVGSVVIPSSLEDSVKELHEFLFPDLEYEVSSTVKHLDERIANKATQHSDGSDYVDDEVNFDSSRYESYGEGGSAESTNETGGQGGHIYETPEADLNHTGNAGAAGASQEDTGSTGAAGGTGNVENYGNGGVTYDTPENGGDGGNIGTDVSGSEVYRNDE